MEKNTLNLKREACIHSPKVICYTIDIGLNEIGILELCQACRLISKLSHVIKTEVIQR